MFKNISFKSLNRRFVSLLVVVTMIASVLTQNIVNASAETTDPTDNTTISDQINGTEDALTNEDQDKVASEETAETENPEPSETVQPSEILPAVEAYAGTQTTIDLSTYVGTLPIQITDNTTLTGTLNSSGLDPLLVEVTGTNVTLTLDSATFSRKNTSNLSDIQFIKFNNSGTVIVNGTNTFSQTKMPDKSIGIVGITGSDKSVDISVIGQNSGTLALANIDTGIGVAISTISPSRQTGKIYVEDLKINSSTDVRVGIGVSTSNTSTVRYATSEGITLAGNNEILSDAQIETGVGYYQASLNNSNVDIKISGTLKIHADFIGTGVGLSNSAGNFTSIGNIEINGDTNITATETVYIGIGTFCGEIGNIIINGDTNISSLGEICAAIGTFNGNSKNIEINGNTDIKADHIRIVGIGFNGDLNQIRADGTNSGDLIINGDTNITFATTVTSYYPMIGIGAYASTYMRDIKIDGNVAVKGTTSGNVNFRGIGSVAPYSHVNSLTISGDSLLLSTQGTMASGVGLANYSINSSGSGSDGSVGDITINSKKTTIFSAGQLNLGVGVANPDTSIRNININSDELDISSDTMLMVGVGSHYKSAMEDIKINSKKINISSIGDLFVGIGAYHENAKAGNVYVNGDELNISSGAMVRVGVGSYYLSSIKDLTIDTKKTTISSTGNMSVGIGAYNQGSITGNINLNGDELNISSTGVLNVGIGANSQSSVKDIKINAKKTTISTPSLLRTGVGAYQTSAKTGNIDVNGDNVSMTSDSNLIVGVGARTNDAQTGNIVINAKNTNLTSTNGQVFVGFGGYADQSSTGTITLNSQVTLNATDLINVLAGAMNGTSKTGDITINKDATLVSKNGSKYFVGAYNETPTDNATIAKIYTLGGNVQEIKDGVNAHVVTSKKTLNAQDEELEYYTMTANDTFTGETVEQQDTAYSTYTYEASKNQAYPAIIGMFFPERTLYESITGVKLDGKVMTIYMDKKLKENTDDLLPYLTINRAGALLTLNGVVAVDKNNIQNVIFTSNDDITLEVGDIITFTKRAFKDAEIGYLKSQIASYTIPLPTYTVTFDKNNTDADSTEANPLTKTVVNPATTIDALPTTNPTRTGYTFLSWNTKADGSGADFTATYAVNGDMTVFAQWEKSPYHVNYIANASNDRVSNLPIDTNIYYFNDTVTVANGKTMTRNRYTFKKWNTLPNGKGTDFSNTFTMPNADVNLYAQWSTVAVTTPEVTPTESPTPEVTNQVVTTPDVTSSPVTTPDVTSTEDGENNTTRNIQETTDETPAQINNVQNIEIPSDMTPTSVADVFVKLDENGTPLGYFKPEVKEDGTSTWVEVDENITPLGTSKKNPKTGDFDTNVYIFIIPVAFLYLLLRSRKNTLNK